MDFEAETAVPKRQQESKINLIQALKSSKDSQVVPLMMLITCPQLQQHLQCTCTFQCHVQRSVTPGECLTSLPVPLTHCTRFRVIPTGRGHLERCSHTLEEDLRMFLMGVNTFQVSQSIAEPKPKQKCSGSLMCAFSTFNLN